ncbi:hypothetical protein [Streptomyces mirabilis]|uniref:hypothetical protein n=1 Tax=Streptomyces mirabilis TaxID=68239 RepID=UPI0036BD2A87
MAVELGVDLCGGSGTVAGPVLPIGDMRCLDLADVEHITGAVLDSGERDGDVEVRYSMSDPATTILAGIRIDGSRVSVKMPNCPSDKVKMVEVYDSDSEKLLWGAVHPCADGGEGRQAEC